MSRRLRLAKIEHTRCSEGDGFTLMWVPLKMTRAEFIDKVYQAQQRYLTTLKEFHESPPPNDYKPYGGPPYAQYQELTVAQVQKLWDEKKAVYMAWYENQQQAQRSFTSYLMEVGLVPFYKQDPELVIDLDWGHHHGWNINADNTELTEIDAQKASHE